MKYEAFISYSQAADGKLAPAIQSGLHRFAKPWYRLRAMRVFRDDTTLALTPALWPKIKRSLHDSGFLVLMASPKAAESPWVKKEVAYWISLTPEKPILIIWTSGDLVWPPDSNDFDWQKTDCLPSELKGYFREGAPLYLDFRWAREDLQLSLKHPKFLNAVAKLASGITGRDVQDLLGQEVVEHRRTRKWVVGASISLALLSIVAAATSIYAWKQQREAIVAKDAEKHARDLADRRAEEAILAQEMEKVQREEAERQKGAALKAEVLAKDAQGKAEASAEEATRQKNISQSNLARANMQRALTHLVNQEWEAAQAILKSTPKVDRQWEWRFLCAWCGPPTSDITWIPLEGPFKEELQKFRRLAEIENPDQSSDIEKPLLPRAFGLTEPFAQLADAYYDGNRKQHGRGWASAKGNIVAGKVAGGGRPGSLVAVLRTDRGASGTLIDSIATSRYGEVWAHIPSKDGSMLFYGGDVEGGDGSVGIAKSGRAIMDRSLFPLGDVFGINWNDRKSKAMTKADKDEDLGIDPLDLGQIAHPNIFATDPEFLQVKATTTLDGFWYGERALFWKGDDPVEGGPEILIDSHNYTFRAMPHARSMRAAEVLEKLRMSIENSTNERRMVTETVVLGERCFVIVSTTPSMVDGETESRWEAWDADSGKVTWTKPDSLANAIADGESATHALSDRLAVYPDMEIWSISEGKFLKTIQGNVHIEGGAHFNPSLSFTPNGRFLVFYGEGRNDVDFGVWEAQSGEQLVSFSGLNAFDDDGNRISNELPDNPVFRQLGSSIPYVLAWERAGKFVVLQKTKDQEVVIYDDLGGKEITRISGITLSQNWYSLEPVTCVVNEELDRLLLGPYLIKASTWEILLQFPEGMAVSADWSRIAVPSGKDSIEVVRVPRHPIPVTLREYLMMREYGWE
jgi:hypothetical protein